MYEDECHVYINLNDNQLHVGCHHGHKYMYLQGKYYFVFNGLGWL